MRTYPMQRKSSAGAGRAEGFAVRVAAGAAGLVTVAAGLAVRATAAGDLAKYAGDALYTVLLHALAVLVAPRLRPGTAAVLAPAASCAVELFQLTAIPANLARRSSVARLVLGSTFDVPDLFWYAAGAALSWALHAAWSEWSRGAVGGNRRTNGARPS